LSKLPSYKTYQYYFQPITLPFFRKVLSASSIDVKAVFLLKVIIGLLLVSASVKGQAIKVAKPNIVLIYTDDVGIGDISCNGTSAVKTPNIDKLAAGGVRFTNVHTTSATCTPSRFSLLTGAYAWRKQGTGIAPGDAALIIPTDKQTLPMMLQQAGYTTGAVGKWHLGLGPQGGPNWNSYIKPGPKEIGFDYSFLLPATGDRVPCVYVENQRVVNLDNNDTISVSYTKPINVADPTGKNNPELLKMQPSHGHDMSIVNGVSRIGYMTGGKSALWVDEEMADVLVKKSVMFIDNNKQKPFFLYLATHDIHVPRMPHSRFTGKSGLGPRGDAILQLDWTVGAIVVALKKRKLLNNTIIIFTSDNGAVLDDGYKDDAAEKLGNHKPNGVFRGGKYSAFEAGTRVPFILSWQGKVAKGKTTDVLLSQVDLYASLAALTGQKIKIGDAPDSKNYLATFLNKSDQSRPFVVEQSINNTLSIIVGVWKYIEPSNGAAINKNTHTELGNLKLPQLYNLDADPGEKNNLAAQQPELVKALKEKLEQIKKGN
jgi:arylsulfatase A-like enzyme